MSGNNDLVTKIAGTSTLERAKFGPGMLLRHDDLEQLNIYPRELSRLLFRSLFGCGVVCGLVVEVDDKCDKVWVTVSCGVALDCSGDPIHVPKKSEPLSFDPEKYRDRQFWVILCGRVSGCSPRTSACASDDEESSPAPSREKDGYEIRIVRNKLPGCICACPEPAKESEHHLANPGQPATNANEPESKCPCVGADHPCYQAHYAGKCGCHDGKDCDCCCDCVVLARLDKSAEGEWSVHHDVRRFVRPVLMRDREVEQDRKRAQEKKAEEDKKLEKALEEKAAAEKAAAEKAAEEKAAAEKAAAEKAAAEEAASGPQQAKGEEQLTREKARSKSSK